MMQEAERRMLQAAHRRQPQRATGATVAVSERMQRLIFLMDEIWGARAHQRQNALQVIGDGRPTRRRVMIADPDLQAWLIPQNGVGLHHADELLQDRDGDRAGAEYHNMCRNLDRQRVAFDALDPVRLANEQIQPCIGHPSNSSNSSTGTGVTAAGSSASNSSSTGPPPSSLAISGSASGTATPDARNAANSASS